MKTAIALLLLALCSNVFAQNYDQGKSVLFSAGATIAYTEEVSPSTQKDYVSAGTCVDVKLQYQFSDRFHAFVKGLAGKPIEELVPEEFREELDDAIFAISAQFGVAFGEDRRLSLASGVNVSNFGDPSVMVPLTFCAKDILEDWKGVNNLDIQLSLLVANGPNDSLGGAQFSLYYTLGR